MDVPLWEICHILSTYNTLTKRTFMSDILTFEYKGHFQGQKLLDLFEIFVHCVYNKISKVNWILTISSYRHIAEIEIKSELSPNDNFHIHFNQL